MLSSCLCYWLVKKTSGKEAKCLTSIELKFNAGFYGKHSCFESALFSKKMLIDPSTVSSLFSLTQTTIDLNLKCYE